MRTRRHSEDVASESYTARVDDANGTITREKKHLTQICVHKIGGSTKAQKKESKIKIASRIETINRSIFILGKRKGTH